MKSPIHIKANHLINFNHMNIYLVMSEVKIKLVNINNNCLVTIKNVAQILGWLFSSPCQLKQEILFDHFNFNPLQNI